MRKFNEGDIVTTAIYESEGEDYTYLGYDASKSLPHRVRRNQRDRAYTGFSKDSALYLVKSDVAAEENAVQPNVYKFPNCEVRDISAHLTGYGSQVLQYVARSTRLDGLFKEDKVQDLEKAKLMIQWEIERLQALEA